MTVEKLITDHIDIWSSALQTRSTAGRGSNGKIDLYGIKKLRELILELAVRGKLVPQDPNDEPASELLKRIAAEKAELVKQGKIKKQKPLPEISEDEKPFELPVGWEWVRLGEVAEIIRGVTYGKAQSSEVEKEGMIPLLRANNIQSKILIEPLVYVDEKLVSSEQYLRTGDVLIAMSSGSESLVGKAAQFYEKGDYTFGAFCGVIRTYFKEINDFIGFFLKTPLYREQTKASGKGIGIKNLNKSNLEMLLVALPSKKNSTQLLEEITFLLTLCDQLEQQSLTNLDAHQQLVETLLATLTDSRNAEELAENWARISQHFDTLFTTEASIDALKQTILQLAVMGKLVPQDPNDEPASELLKRIEQEKAQLVKEGKIKKQKPLPPVSDEDKPFELPEGWETVYMQDISELITDGTHQTPKYTENGRPFVSAQCVKPFKFMPENCRFVSEDDYQQYIKNRKPELNDILLSRVGAGIGESAVIDSDLEFAIYVSTGLIKPMKKNINSNYLVLWLNSPIGRGFSSKYTYGKGVSQGNLNLSLIRSFLVSLPPRLGKVRTSS
ncbi:restriction endonuclease subunit S [Raoultella planticola]|uniref:restriction endonuclease subunit S n=1 Tax=Raoultella planticola TaxID=575 RepID=UPI0021AFFC1C|nr:restriction endonuclease subunit S [Raoultella planticola]MCS7493477.1 restriction endonuclease subunit S [Raoultella planticola]MDC3911301.1 restriction endonuclease subunit S [Raoultella planticola]